LHAIAAVGRGEIYFEASLAAKVLARQLGRPSSRGGPPPARLSQRESEVPLRLAWGFSNKEIAAELDLSVKTVETYKARLGEKLGLRSRTHIVQYALRQGWLNAPCPPGPM